MYLGQHIFMKMVNDLCQIYQMKHLQLVLLWINWNSGR